MKSLIEELTAEDIAPWREHYVSKLLLNWLKSIHAETLETVSDCVARGKIDDARVATGGLEFVKSMLSVLYPPAAQIEEEEVPFVDPATRRSVLRAKNG